MKGILNQIIPLNCNLIVAYRLVKQGYVLRINKQGTAKHVEIKQYKTTQIIIG